MTAMDLPIQSIDSLRAEGSAAARNGVSRDMNPFPRHCGHYRQWAHGYVWGPMGPQGALMVSDGQGSDR